MKSKKQGSFTLIELIVVIAIIAIASVIIVPVALNSIEKAKVTNCGQTLTLVKKAAMTYYADTGLWAPNQSHWCTDTKGTDASGELAGMVCRSFPNSFFMKDYGESGWDGPYLSADLGFTLGMVSMFI